MLSNYYQILGISEQEVNTLQEVFQIYAKKKDYIQLEQLQQILLDLGITITLETISQIIDLNQDKKIDFYEFIVAISYYIPPIHTTTIKRQDQELLRCFLYFDKDHDGRISQLELEDVMKKLNAKLSPYEIKEMMKTADMNKDGFVDFDEFKQLLTY
ncbi:hypothetical protein RO3G_16222 [Rhizopus delemar RA 99-880]|uniref:EF-hand domain-containing protein n=2 Tax=Rhizopus delemar TaxID=936053 RepID=I1CST1_RHIO9|nr:hypothetical protein RO3G_16222 [Rhizopus delemar RA 99-880]KAG1051717.1 hypothetical protein G6F43_006098 [Rhizopus delemar]KAG1488209.1 hypothetical protein G6F54_012193 [Rhizopus delemar]KAG1496068.1 hypothetical protein G6F53_012250 [Rhizopus delemar]KAG1565281.1 hypothetical protein G6F50_010216 [Rhizopus delemar]|eukprot:EIE91511.1 hypothetical protein RO3G_16222 [Rhizopus delemar RA 99-880]